MVAADGWGRILLLGVVAASSSAKATLAPPRPASATLVGSAELVFARPANASSDFYCFKIPALVHMKGALLAFAEARRGGCGDFDRTELVFRVRPTGDAGEPPGAWSAVTSLSALLNSSGCSASAGCLPPPCRKHMSNAAPAVTDYEAGELLMVYNCENSGVYAVKLRVGRVVQGTAEVEVASAVQTVLSEPPRASHWVAVGPPASLVVDAEGAVLVPTYFAWHRKPEIIDGLDSYGMTLRYDLASGSWSVPCAQYGNAKGDVNEHQYFVFNEEVWALSRSSFINPMRPRRTLLRRQQGVDGDRCFQQVSQPRFDEEIEGCQGSVLSLGGRVFYTGVDGGVLSRTRLTLFEARGTHAANGTASIKSLGQPDDLAWDPLAVVYEHGSGYSALSGVDDGLLGVLYERNPHRQVVFEPAEIVLQRINVDGRGSHGEGNGGAVFI